MRVLVCGSRNFNDYAKLNEELNEIQFKDTDREFTTIIHGAARGTDTLAGEYAERYEIPCVSFPADWKLHGKAAGPIRNTQMLREGRPDLVIAFRAKDSRGTQNMIDQARKAGIRTKVIEV